MKAHNTYADNVSLSIGRTLVAELDDDTQHDAPIWTVEAKLANYRDVTYGPFDRTQAVMVMNQLAPAFNAIAQAFADATLAVDTCGAATVPDERDW